MREFISVTTRLIPLSKRGLVEIKLDLKIYLSFISATLRLVVSFREGLGRVNTLHFHGKLNSKDRAFERYTLRGQFGTMRIGDPSPDRKSQAAASLRFSLSKISLIEPFEDMQTYILRHANARIAHGHE